MPIIHEQDYLIVEPLHAHGGSLNDVVDNALHSIKHTPDLVVSSCPTECKTDGIVIKPSSSTKQEPDHVVTKSLCCIKRPREHDTDDIVQRPEVRKLSIQPHIDQYIHRIEKKRIDDALAEFIIGCNIPLEAVEHPTFVAMVKGLRPGYTMPCLVDLFKSKELNE